MSSRRTGPTRPAPRLGQLALVRARARLFPGVPQVACFDTAFFRALPSIATALGPA
jgi:acetate kinase